jgi:hypothetical protein
MKKGKNGDVKLCPSILSEKQDDQACLAIIYCDRIGWYKTPADDDKLSNDLWFC